VEGLGMKNLSKHISSNRIQKYRVLSHVYERDTDKYNIKGKIERYRKREEM
jgi:hypothetical protein